MLIRPCFFQLRFLLNLFHAVSYLLTYLLADDATLTSIYSIKFCITMTVSCTISCQPSTEIDHHLRPSQAPSSIIRGEYHYTAYTHGLWWFYCEMQYRGTHSTFNVNHILDTLLYLSSLPGCFGGLYVLLLFLIFNNFARSVISSLDLPSQILGLVELWL